jgi:type IV secretion system protein VirB1
MAAVMRVESTFNPFAIGVVGGRLERQPTNRAEAVATAAALETAGYNFSLGIGQVNRYNLPKYGLDYERAFDPCANLRAASLILKECYDRAKGKGLADESALQASFSCYYSGNFSTGFRPDFKGQPSYVQKVIDSAAALSGSGKHAAPIRVIPAAQATTPTKTSIRADIQVTAKASESTPFTATEGGSVRDSVMVYR